MKKSSFSEVQIICILREQEAGATTAEVCRRHGISSATFYALKAMFGGMRAKREKAHRGARRIQELFVKRLAGDVRFPAQSTDLQGGCAARRRCWRRAKCYDAVTK